jgi:hypothetical protein
MVLLGFEDRTSQLGISSLTYFGRILPTQSAILRGKYNAS